MLMFRIYTLIHVVIVEVHPFGREMCRYGI